jgi:hypothetical protein
VHGGRDSSETRGENAAYFFGPVIVQLKGFCQVKPKLLAQRLATFRTKKAADARIMAECARVAKDVVFVAADDSQAVITAEMRELISEALDLLADREG